MSYKLPENLIETLKAEAEKRGATQTALMIQGLQHVLGIASSTAVDAADIDLRLESAIAPLRLEVDALKAEMESLRLRMANQSPTIRKQPSENAPQSVPKKVSVRLDVPGDKARCPACGLNLLRREGFGKPCRLGENVGKRRQRWTCTNPKCDRCGRSFLGDWAN